MPNAKGLITDPMDWLQALVEYYVVESNEERYDPGWHHPSALKDPCLRAIQFAFIAVPVTQKPNFYMAFASKVGTYIHHLLLEELLHQHERVLRVEQGMEDPVNHVRGTFDLEVLDPDGREALGDLKSAAMLPKEGSRTGHLTQGAWYLYLSGHTRFFNLYINRANGAMARFTYHWPDLLSIWEDSARRVRQVNELTADGKLAPMTPESRAQCKDCKYLRSCLRAQEGDGTEWTPLLMATRQATFGSEKV